MFRLQPKEALRIFMCDPEFIGAAYWQLI